MSDDKKPSRYLVGYKRPPPEHRFQKGRSGNPAGRPRKKTEKKSKGSGATPLDDILMAEALRPIQIRENDKVIEIPMIQAVIRSLGVAAVKGSHRSQLALAQMVKVVQDQNYQALQELFKSAIEYKDSWYAHFEECDRRGEPRPDPVPHPDDIVLDSSTMKVKFNGPIGYDDKKKWDAMLKRRQEALAEIEELKIEKQGYPNPGTLDIQIAAEERIADVIGCIIPDEATRRRPGFDLQEWRDQKGAIRKLKEKWKAPRPWLKGSS